MAEAAKRAGARAFERVVVIGDGGWGTALSLVLLRRGVSVALWSPFAEQARDLTRDRENKRFLPGVPLPPELAITADPIAACKGADLAVSVVPTQFLRDTLGRFEEALPGNAPIVSGTKGIEIETFRTPSEIVSDVLGDRPIAVLTGPSHAEEVARMLPASVVVASRDEELARRVQATFNGETFRVYTIGDPHGAELAAALKNVIAVAAGICDGLQLGDNAKAALLTRGMVEMARFGRAHGAKLSTFFGLAGFGDLVTTCCSPHSRNRAVGERLGRGEKLADILSAMKMVAEGVWTTQALFGPESEARMVPMPIAEQVHAVLFEGRDPRRAVLELMQREPTGEMDGLI